MVRSGASGSVYQQSARLPPRLLVQDELEHGQLGPSPSHSRTPRQLLHFHRQPGHKHHQQQEGELHEAQQHEQQQQQQKHQQEHQQPKQQQLQHVQQLYLQPSTSPTQHARSPSGTALAYNGIPQSPAPKGSTPPATPRSSNSPVLPRKSFSGYKLPTGAPLAAKWIPKLPKLIANGRALAGRKAFSWKEANVGVPENSATSPLEPGGSFQEASMVLSKSVEKTAPFQRTQVPTSRTSFSGPQMGRGPNDLNFVQVSTSEAVSPSPPMKVEPYGVLGNNLDEKVKSASEGGGEARNLGSTLLKDELAQYDVDDVADSLADVALYVAQMEKQAAELTGSAKQQQHQQQQQQQQLQAGTAPRRHSGACPKNETEHPTGGHAAVKGAKGQEGKVRKPCNEVDWLQEMMPRGQAAQGDALVVRTLRRSLSTSFSTKMSALGTPLACCKVHSFDELAAATDNWSKQNVLGHGRFGRVFRGHLRGYQVAVKRMESTAATSQREYMAELEVLSRVRHPNIMQLLGHCPQSCSLVYEFVPGGNLQSYLGPNSKRPLLWRQRVKILEGVASALLCLHQSEPPIVHRDVKPHNIMLDAGLQPKLGDAGLARLLEVDTDDITSGVSGTFGYIDPEMLVNMEISPTNDVYAFGVVCLQLLTGQPKVILVHKLISECSSQGALKAVVQRTAHAFVDRADVAAGDWPLEVIMTLADLGVRCSSRNQFVRPDLELEVLPALRKLSTVQPPPQLEIDVQGICTPDAS